MLCTSFIHFLRCSTVRSFMDWVDALASSSNMAEYRKRFSDGESMSWWQSLAFGPNYTCGHCLAVCPAGSETIEEFRSNPQKYKELVVRPLVEQQEFVYAIPGSEAEKAVLANVAKKLRPVTATFVTSQNNP